MSALVTTQRPGVYETYRATLETDQAKFHVTWVGLSSALELRTTTAIGSMQNALDRSEATALRDMLTAALESQEVGA